MQTFKVGDKVRVKDDAALDKEGTIVQIHDGGNGWGVRIALNSAPTVAADLRLTPQARTVLRHMKKHGDITPMKAMVVYGISRLASCIHEIRRKAGYDVETMVDRDDQGHKYAVYTLATVD